jgi:hypothetical protein
MDQLRYLRVEGFLVELHDLAAAASPKLTFRFQTRPLFDSPINGHLGQSSQKSSSRVDRRLKFPEHLAGHQGRTAHGSQSRSLHPRRCPWDRFAPRSIDFEERGLDVATICCPLSSRTAIVLQLKQSQLCLSCRFSLFTPELENVAPSVALAVDDDKRERASQVSTTCGASRFLISLSSSRAIMSVTLAMNVINSWRLIYRKLK